MVTEDVDDFTEVDLRTAGVTAVNPDLFLAARADRDVYRRALEVMVSGMADPSRTPAELHAAISRQHPRLFQRHRVLFEVEPQPSGHRPPATLYRGLTCLRCLTRQPREADLINGQCPSCTAATFPDQPCGRTDFVSADRQA